MRKSGRKEVHYPLLKRIMKSNSNLYGRCDPVTEWSTGQHRLLRGGRVGFGWCLQKLFREKASPSCGRGAAVCWYSQNGSELVCNFFFDFDFAFFFKGELLEKLVQRRNKFGYLYAGWGEFGILSTRAHARRWNNWRRRGHSVTIKEFGTWKKGLWSHADVSRNNNWCFLWAFSRGGFEHMGMNIV